MRSPRTWLLPLLLVILLLLPACGSELSEEDLVGRGGPTPQAAVESFLATLNEALQADLADETARRGWAERLASYFAPSERADQRIVFSRMLAAYVQSAARPVYGSTATVQITYTGTEVIERQGDRAVVRVVDGQVTLQWLDGEGQVVRERTSALTALMGQTEGFPVLRVGGSWFITEG